MHLGSALAVCDRYGLFLQSDQYLIHKVEAFLNYFGLKTPSFTFSERNFSTLKLFKLYRSSRSQMLFEIDVLKNFSNFTGKHLCWSLFLIKLQAGLQLY